MMYCIKIIGISNGAWTPFDGQYLVEYNPARPGMDPFGREMTALVETTSDPARARLFRDQMEALEYWRQSYGTRPDGEPNRPLTAFHVVVEPLETKRPPTFGGLPIQ